MHRGRRKELKKEGINERKKGREREGRKGG